MYRNLYAKDYLKDHDVTREQFEVVWKALEEDLRKVF
jgi:hypothetical protein